MPHALQWMGKIILHPRVATKSSRQNSMTFPWPYHKIPWPLYQHTCGFHILCQWVGNLSLDSIERLSKNFIRTYPSRTLPSALSKACPQHFAQLWQVLSQYKIQPQNIGNDICSNAALLHWILIVLKKCLPLSPSCSKAIHSSYQFFTGRRGRLLVIAGSIFPGHVMFQVW